LYGKMGINPEKDLYWEILKPLMRNKVCY
jgi:hypothetical protein